MQKEKWVLLLAVGVLVSMGSNVGTVEAAPLVDIKESYKSDNRNQQLSLNEYAELMNDLKQSPVSRSTMAVSQSNVTGQRKAIVNESMKHLGKPYTQEQGKRMGPNAFDCSGLTNYVFARVTGRNIGTWTVPQENSGTKISVATAQAGDLYFWGTAGNTYHVAIATGNNQYVHSPTYGQTVKVGSVSSYEPDFALKMNLTGGTPTNINLNNYLTSNPGYIVTNYADNVYSSTEFNANTKGQLVPKGSVLTVQSIEYSNGGVPRLKTNLGYYSAAKRNVTKVVSSIMDYHTNNPGKVVALKDDHTYSSLEFSTATKSRKIAKGTLLDVQSIEYSSGGVPRIKTSSGYYTAHKSNIRKVISNINDYYISNPKKVVTLKDDVLYTSVEFSSSTRKKTSKAGNVLIVLGVEYSGSGVPRLKTNQGYYSAAKNNVMKTIKTVESYYTVNPVQIISLKNDYLYRSTTFNTNTKGRLVLKGEKLLVQKIEYTPDGTPRLKTKNGYFTAHMSNVTKIK